MGCVTMEEQEEVKGEGMQESAAEERTVEDDMRMLDLEAFSQSEKISTMQRAALESWARHQNILRRHATAAEWRAWLDAVLKTEIVS